MSKLRVFEAFAGVGSQRMALRNLGIDHEVIAIAEIDSDALISYAAIHHTDENIELPSVEKMIAELTNKNVGLDFKSGKVKLPKGAKLAQLYKSDKLSRNIGDVSRITTENLPDHDLFTYSFPCQDISIAGQGKGLSEGAGTRSSLLWECQRVIEGKKPKYLLLENVKNLVGKKNKPDFDKWLEWLESQGYKNFWQVLNAKDQSIPQNRERVFVVSILTETAKYEFIRDQTLGIKPDGSYGVAIDNIEYEFPKKQELKLRLKDILEEEVDNKYYLSKEIQERFVYKPRGANVIGTTAPEFRTIGQRDEVYHDNGVMGALVATDYKQPKQILVEGLIERDGWSDQDKRVYNKEGIAPTQTVGGNTTQILDVKQERLGGVFDTEKSKHQAGSVWNTEGISPTLDTMQGGWRQPCIMIKNATKQGYLEATDGDGIDLNFPDSKTRRGRVQQGMSQTLTTGDHLGVIVKGCAMRGRYNEDGTTSQQLELRKDELCNTVTTVQKDSLVAQVNSIIIDDTQGFDGVRYYENYSPTLRNQRSGLKTIDSDYRIRKLTPRECWRLMGFTDEDFDKAKASGVSDSQLYKQAGNSIVVNVLEGIFSQLFLK